MNSFSFARFIVALKDLKNFVWRQRLPYFLSAIASFFGVFTYLALTRDIAQGASNYLVLTLLYCDIAILVLLAIVIARRLYELWSERRLGLKGAKLHVQIVALFSVVSIMPALIVAMFSAHFFNVAVNAWFAKPVHNALEQANILAESYLNEHKKVINIDAFALIDQIRPRISHYLDNPDQLEERLNTEAENRKLAEIMVFRNLKTVNVVAKSYFTFMPIIQNLTQAFKNAKKEDFVILESKDRVRAVIKIDPISDTYLFIGKNIDPVVIQHVNKTHEALQDYRLSAVRHSEIQITFILFFVIVTLLLLMAAIWIGLTIADMMVKPVTKLIKAAEAVSQGDLSVKLTVENVNNELDDLCRSFNKMTHQLVQQKHDLILSEKKSTWADMARKIAHEIKNPLTPIQLSAERLKRKYLKEIQNDSLTFQTCIDTIIRQVGTIESLVTEFSNFARMPEPRLEPVDWVMLAQSAIVLHQQSHPKIIFLFDTQKASIVCMIDPLQMTQVLNNLMQNAINAVVENLPMNRKPIVKIKLHIIDTMLYIRVEDSGSGFPIEGRSKYMEPYYTTREKGTGLGLAIVSKIVSDHNGRLDLLDSDELGGASVQLSFMLKK